MRSLRTWEEQPHCATATESPGSSEDQCSPNAINKYKLKLRTKNRFIDYLYNNFILMTYWNDTILHTLGENNIELISPVSFYLLVRLLEKSKIMYRTYILDLCFPSCCGLDSWLIVYSEPWIHLRILSHKHFIFIPRKTLSSVVLWVC